MLTRARQIEIEIEVVTLLQELGINRYPMSVQDLAEGLGIELVKYSSLSVEERALAKAASDDAFHVRTANFYETRIVLDDRGAYYFRSRFSGAHEIGHIWLEHREGTADREAEADYFAGYLLVPHPLVLTASAGESVSDLFGVSGQCADYAQDQARVRLREGASVRPHERWLLDNVVWEGGGLVGRL